MGDGPVYLSFDIDALDPSFAPGTGTPEIAGLTSMQVRPMRLPPGGVVFSLLKQEYGVLFVKTGVWCFVCYF